MSARASSKRHVCTHPGCNAAFSRPNRLVIHTRSHTGDRPFQCTVAGCDKQYARKQHLRRHIVTTHERHLSPARCGAFVCTEPGCHQILSSRDALAKHVRNHRRRQHQCSVCLRSFHKRQQLVSHGYVHTGVRPWLCGYGGCEQRFLTPSRLHTHRQRHLTRYVCSQCGEELLTWRALVLHRRRHQHRATATSSSSPSSNTGHACSECSAVLLSASSLRAHTSIHQERRPVFPCPLLNCARYYYYQRNLTQHLHTAHQGVGYVCSVGTCRKTFTTRHRWAAHMQLHGKTLTQLKRPQLTRVVSRLPPGGAENTLDTLTRKQSRRARVRAARRHSSVFTWLTGEPDPDSRQLTDVEERALAEERERVARSVLPAHRPPIPLRLSPAR